MEKTITSLRVHNRLKSTKVLGPGIRYALWVQGCDKNCNQCMSPETRSKEGGVILEINQIFNEIMTCKDIEGITVSGGEPFLQFEGLYELLILIKENTDLSVIIYTGYYLKELKDKKEEKIDAIIEKLSDIIIDGPYMDELNDGLSLRGSSNQHIHVLSDRYADTYHNTYGVEGREVEIRLSGNDALLVGIPDKNGYEMWNHVVRRMISKRKRKIQFD